MEQELLSLRTVEDKPYTLFPLPLPDPCFDEDGNKLPATHANFLIINRAVLVPTYHQPDKDCEALAQLKIAFPNREVIGIISGIDRDRANVEQAERWLKLCGCERIFPCSSFTGEGLEAIIEYLREPGDTPDSRPV